MKKIPSYRVLIVSLFFLLCATPLIAGDSIKLFSGTGAYITKFYDSVRADDEIYKLEPLPGGIIPESIFFHNTHVRQWIFKNKQTGMRSLKRYKNQSVEYIDTDKKQKKAVFLDLYISPENTYYGLLSYNENLIYVPILSIIFPQEEDLTLEPELLVQREKDFSRKQDFNVSYFTRDISSSLVYKAVLQENGLQLNSYVFITNQTDLNLKSLSLSLEVGKSYLDYSNPKTMGFQESRSIRASRTMADSAQTFAVQDLYVYRILAPVDLPSGMLTAQQLFQVNLPSVSRVFIYRPGRIKTSQESFDNATVYLRGINTSDKPLAAAQMEVLDEQRQILARVPFKDTPIGDEIFFPIQKAFDILARKVLHRSFDLNRNERIEEFRIELKNLKSTAVSIEIIDTIYYPDWEIRENTHPYEQMDASTIKFLIPVTEKGSESITYKVSIKKYPKKIR